MKRLYLTLATLGMAVLAWAASTTTPLLSLTKPGVGDTGWGSSVNTNFDTIDRLGSTLDTNGQLRASIVKSTHIASVSGQNLEANCVKSSHVVDGTLTGADLAANTVAGSNLQADCVKSSHVADGSLTGADLAANTVRGSNLEANCVVSTHIVNQSIQGDDVAAGVFVSSHVQNNSLKHGIFGAGIYFSTYVPTSESMSSTSYVQLASSVGVTFTLDVARTVIIIQSCLHTAQQAMSTISIDGEALSDAYGAGTWAGGAANIYMGISSTRVASLSSGTHSVTQFYKTSAGTENFSERRIVVFVLGP